MHIVKNCVVSIRYIMKNGNGEILENTMNGEVVSYLQGSNGILYSLQAQLEGQETGDKKLVYLKSASGFTNEDFIFEVIIDDVREALNEELLLGYPVQLHVPKCDVDCVCYNEVIS